MSRKKQTIYVVTSGEYSDYSIDALFSTKQLAQEWIALKSQEKYSSYDGYNIEEWLLDSQVGAKRVIIWRIGIALDDGAILEDPGPRDAVAVPFRAVVIHSAVSVPRYDGRKITLVESAVSREHAVKFAVEQRQKWLRENSK